MIARKSVFVVVAISFMAMLLYLIGPLDVGASEKVSPTKSHARDFYAPNSEDLMPDEMRLL